MFTRMAPICAVAYWATIHSALLALQMPTRLPFWTPRVIRPRATRSTSALSSA